MRLLLDANVLLDCLILEVSEAPRKGSEASEMILDLCDQGIRQGLVAWHTLPIIAHYHRKQHTADHTAAMIDDLLAMVYVPTTGHREALNWRSHQMPDFEDALQVCAAFAGKADIIITRNISDIVGCSVRVLTPEEFLGINP